MTVDVKPNGPYCFLISISIGSISLDEIGESKICNINLSQKKKKIIDRILLFYGLSMVYKTNDTP